MKGDLPLPIRKPPGFDCDDGNPIGFDAIFGRLFRMEPLTIKDY